MKNKKIYEIIILGRGGQGAKTLGEMIARGAGLEGKYVQAFPEFGPERSGAPVKAFVRISDEKIRTRQPVVDPDCVLVLDEKLLADKKSLEKLDKSEPLIVNSALTVQQLKEKWKLNQQVAIVNASSLAEEYLGKNFPNLGVFGCFIFVTEKINLESGMAAYEEIYSHKLDPNKISAGKKVIGAAYHPL